MVKKRGSAFQKPVKISTKLSAVIGKGPMSRSQVMKKIWAYIKRHDLQHEKNRSCIELDEKLAKSQCRINKCQFDQRSRYNLRAYSDSTIKTTIAVNNINKTKMVVPKLLELCVFATVVELGSGLAISVGASKLKTY